MTIRNILEAHIIRIVVWY